MSCLHVLLTGKNKGKPCGKKALHGYCINHKNKHEEDIKVNQTVAHIAYQQYIEKLNQDLANQRLESFKQRKLIEEKYQLKREQEKVKTRLEIEEKLKEEPEYVKKLIEENLNQYLEGFFDTGDCYWEALDEMGCAQDENDFIIIAPNGKKYKVGLIEIN